MVDNAVDTEKRSTLAIIDIPNRTLADVEWTTSVPEVASLPEGKKVLVNPNTIVLIDERDNES